LETNGLLPRAPFVNFRAMRLLCAIVAGLFSVSALAQDAPPTPAPSAPNAAAEAAPSPAAEPNAPKGGAAAPVMLHVAVRNIEPFCFEENGRRKGFAIELWAAIAKEAGVQYDMHTVASAQAMVDELAAKKADVGVSALSITSQRMLVIDFSHPFYDSGLDILTASKGHNSPLHFIKLLFNPELLKTLGLLFIAALIFPICSSIAKGIATMKNFRRLTNTGCLNSSCGRRA
jgi:ABC-type amino acid transport substrate-binding protein